MRNATDEPIQRCREPRRYKLAFLTFIGLLAPVYFVPPALSAVLSGPHLVSFSAAVAGIVLLMTYVIMPVLTHIAAGWLFEQSSETAKNPRE